MMGDEDFDELFREKLQNRKFTVDPSKWNKVEKLIVAQEQKQKRKRIWIYAAVFLLLIAATSLLLIPDHPENFVMHDPKAGETNEPVVRNVSPAPVVSPSGNAAPITENTPALSEKPEETTAGTDKMIKEQENIRNFDQKAVAESKIQSRTAHERLGPDLMPASKKAVSQNELSGRNELSGTNKEEDLNQDVLNITEHKNSTPLVKVDGSLHGMIKKWIPVPVPQFSKRSLSPVPNAVFEWNKEVQIADNKTRKGYISLQAGVNYVHGFSFSFTQRTGRSYNAALGVAYTRTFQSPMELAIGMHYTSISNVSETGKLYSLVSYGFGYKASNTVIKLEKLHYLSSPLTMKYKLSSKNNLLVGATAFCLLNTTSMVTTYLSNDDRRENETKKKEYGYKQGIKPFDIGINAGYERNLNEKISLMLVCNYGLSDMKDNIHFENSTFERNLSMQFIVNYKLLKKGR